jgi:hypothetical protein
MNCDNCYQETKVENECNNKRKLDLNNERSKEYYKAHREEILSKLRSDENRIRIHEYNKQYYEKNKKKILDRCKEKKLTPEQIEERKSYMKNYREQKKLMMTEEDIERRRQYMKEYRRRLKEKMVVE